MRLFHKMDKDKSGGLSQKEMAKALKKMLKKEKGISAGVLEQIFTRIDANGDHRITQKEFLDFFELPDA